MSRQRVGWLVTLAVLMSIVVVTAPAFPQETDPGTTDQPAPEVDPEEARRTVETILREQEEMLTGQRFTYDPEGRRDPFRSLFDLAQADAGPRPPGIAGMTVDEIDLAGIVADPSGGDVAYFTGSDNKGYFVRVGERIYDATMIAIDTRAGSVTFRQKIDDPRQIKPYRDIVRRLVPLEESAR